MKGFILSLQSEFYKSRKTLGFWCAVILPVVICSLVCWGVYSHADKLKPLPPLMQWLQFSSAILNVMGSLLLPIYVIIVAYSVNNIEHKADTWKTLFSLPLSKLSVYAAKYFYALFLVFLCLALFVLFTLGFGNLLSIVKPGLKFNEYSVAGLLTQLYLKFFLAALGILSIQFLLSLLFSDFLKPMGIGFVCTITGRILASNNWEYAYLFPYSHPMMAMKALSQTHPKDNGVSGKMPEITINMFTHETWVSLAVAIAVFIAGYYIVLKRSVK